jgi:hypothetical protein
MVVSTCRIDVQPDLRRGYVLHLTNLEDRPFQYLVGFVLTVLVSPMGGVVPPARELDEFVRFTGDGIIGKVSFRRLVASVNHPMQGGVSFTTGVYVLVGGHQTKRIGMEPFIPVGLAGLAHALNSRTRGALDHLEGYVTLRLPIVRFPNRQFLTFPQSSDPVRVLVNPETRTVYRTGGQRLDIWTDEPPIQGGFGSWWGQPPIDPPPVKSGFTYAPAATIERTEPLHVATGKAENALTPDSPKSLTVESLNYALDAVNAGTLEEGDYRGAASVADEDRAGALIELLMELGDDAELSRAVNKVLEDQQAPVRIRRP